MAPITKLVLQSLIDAADNGKFQNAADLFKAVVKMEAAKKRELSAEDCATLAVQLNCTFKSNFVEKGRKGKPKLEVSADDLRNEIEKLESGRTFESMGDLWEAVADTEWAKTSFKKPLSVAVIMQRVKEFGIKTKTKPSDKKGRRDRLEISLEDLQKAVDQVEQNRTFDKLTDLWEAVAQTDWAKGLQPRPLTAPVAYQRANELGVVTKTKSARKKIESMPAAVVDVQDEEEEIPEEPKKKPNPILVGDKAALQNSGIPSFRGIRLVGTPAGACPVKLAGTDQEVVESWCFKVVSHFYHAERMQMTPSALIYFAASFFDRDTPEFEEVRAAIIEAKPYLYTQLGREAA